MNDVVSTEIFPTKTQRPPRIFLCVLSGLCGIYIAALFGRRDAKYLLVFL